MTIVSPVPFTLQNGQVADATQVMANFNAIVAGVNAGAAASGANSDITALLGLTTPIPFILGGTPVYIGGAVTGTANAVVLATPAPPGFSLTKGYVISWLVVTGNTGPLTLNANAAGVKNVFRLAPTGVVACVGGETVAGMTAVAIYDGTQFVLMNSAVSTAGPSTTVASAATVDLGLIYSHNANITGVVTITSFGSSADTVFPIYRVKFAGALILTYNATSLIIPGAQNVTTTAGDVAELEYLGGGNWRVRSYTFANPQFVPIPQGRLTLTTGVPVMAADVTTSASVFYTPWQGNQVPVWNGLTFTPTPFSELTLTLSNPNHAANTNYDVFVAFNGTTLTLCTGPPWTSDTARGSGAGTTQLTRSAGGLLTNTVSMTARNGATTFTVGAGAGTYVGTVRTSASAGDTLWIANPAAAAGGGNCRLLLWNMYNRVPVAALSKDSTDSWTYAATTWRAANNNNNNRITAVFGVNEDAVSAAHNAMGTWDNDSALVGVGLDSTSAWSGFPSLNGSSYVNGTTLVSTFGSAVATYLGQPGLGLHFFQALEYNVSGTTTFYGDNGAPLNYQMALSFMGRM